MDFLTSADAYNSALPESTFDYASFLADIPPEAPPALDDDDADDDDDEVDTELYANANVSAAEDRVNININTTSPTDDNIAIVQDSSAPEATMMDQDFYWDFTSQIQKQPQQNNANESLPIQASTVTQSFSEFLNSDSAALDLDIQSLANPLELQAQQQALFQDLLQSQQPQSQSQQSTPALAPSPRDSVVSLSRNSTSSASSLPDSGETVRTEEERKARNRIYAKRSRDLKNQKFKEAMDLNKELQKKLQRSEDQNWALQKKLKSAEDEKNEMRNRIKQLEQSLHLLRMGSL